MRLIAIAASLAVATLCPSCGEQAVEQEDSVEEVQETTLQAAPRDEEEAAAELYWFGRA